MCCMRARPAAFAAAAAGVGWGERQRARGGGAAGPPGLVGRPASQGQESLEICETKMLAFCGIDGRDISLRAPPHYLWGPEQGQAVDSAGGDRECPVCGRSEGARGGGCVRKNWRHESPAATVNSAVQEYLLCPCCVSGTVLEVNGVDPAFSPPEHSLHFHFALRLIGLMGRGEDPFSPTLSKISSPQQ